MGQPELSRPWWLGAVTIAAIYLFFATCRARTEQPWNDEAWYSTPSLSLLQNGGTGTPYLETTNKFWRGIHERTYWVVPLQFFVQVPWFKVFGFSLFTSRALAIVWGLAGLITWGLIVRHLTKDEVTALAAMLFIACDYQFDSQMALGRMDAMALAYSSLAMLLYLVLRERHLGVAIFSSQLCVVACGLTHPTPGVPAFIAILVLTLYLDRHRLRWRHLLPVVVPYLLGVAFWGWYISPSPDLFRAQFFGNVTDIDRLGGLTHPLRAILRELQLRYAGLAGFLPGMHPLYRIKAAAILVYAIAVVSLFAVPSTRRHPGIRVLLLLWTVYFVCMTFYDNTKEVKYAIHIIALYDVLVGVWFITWWRSNRNQKLIAAAAATAFLFVNVGGTLYTSFVQDDYHKSYLPAAAFLQREAGRGDLIMASSEIGFALGFDKNVVDDNSFLFDSHKVPMFIVMDRGYAMDLEYSRTAHPEIYLYFHDLLNRQYKLVYDQRNYRIFERQDKLDSGKGSD